MSPVLESSCSCSLMTTGVTIPKITLTGRNSTAVNVTMRGTNGMSATNSPTIEISGKMIRVNILEANKMAPSVDRAGNLSAMRPPM